MINTNMAVELEGATMVSSLKRIKNVTFFSLSLSSLCCLVREAQAAQGASMEQGIITALEPFITVFSGNPWIKGGMVIVITFTVASFLTWLLFKLLGRISASTRFDLDDHVVKILRPPVYYSLLVTGISAGLNLLPIADKIIVLSGRCIKSIGVIIWVIFFTRFATLLLKRLAGVSHKYSFIQNRTVTLFDNVAKIFIFCAGTYTVFVIWNIDMTAWLASAGIVGIAIGFAAKDTLSNLFSGVFILADAPYEVGDYVVLDRVDRGKVTNIGLRSTRILTRDDVEITVPNSIIGNSTIINQSGGPTRKLRIRIKVGVAYGTDIDLVRSFLLDIAKNDPNVCKVPESKVRFRVFGHSSLDLELRCWVAEPELHGRTLDSLNDAIYKRFTEEKIEIPYAKQDLYIKGLPDQLSGVRTGVGDDPGE